MEASMIRSIARGAALLALALGIAWPAFPMAHGYLLRSFPAPKSSLTRSPRHVELVFSLRVDPKYSIVQLEDHLGNILAIKAQDRRSRQFTMDAPTLDPGRYRIVYRMLAPDGDLMQGRIDFGVGE
jgi:methionine-rich copper-binding protein CopC